MKDLPKSIEAQHNLAAKAFADALKKCQRDGVSPDVAAQTLLSFGRTLLLSTCEPDDAARTLEGMAALIRSGEMTKDDI